MWYRQLLQKLLNNIYFKSEKQMFVSFQDNREMPVVADNRKCSPTAVKNKEYASGSLKDQLRDIVGFTLKCLSIFHPNCT